MHCNVIGHSNIIHLLVVSMYVCVCVCTIFIPARLYKFRINADTSKVERYTFFYDDHLIKTHIYIITMIIIVAFIIIFIFIYSI